MPRDPFDDVPDSWGGVAPGVFRLPGYGGAALFLRSHVVPDRSPEGTGGLLALDVGLLDPYRLVHYLARPAAEGFVDRLARFLFSAASEFHPEKTLATFADEAMGLTISALASTDDRVEIEVAVIPDPGVPMEDADGLNFETSRAALVTASQEVRALDASWDDDVLGEVL
jgi:hypothetical protein